MSDDPLPVTRQICSRCGGEGRLIHEVSMWSEPVAHDGGECPVCEGTGYELIETKEIEEEARNSPRRDDGEAAMTPAKLAEIKALADDLRIITAEIVESDEGYSDHTKMTEDVCTAVPELVAEVERLREALRLLAEWRDEREAIFKAGDDDLAALPSMFVRLGKAELALMTYARAALESK